VVAGWGGERSIFKSAGEERLELSHGRNPLLQQRYG
jgi:hypothetical protein